ncbi:MAG: GTP cyclohydrolase I FolE [Candidatus Eisenbacteria bacterium]
MNKARVAELTRELLKEIGEDPERVGLRRTPERVAEAWAFLVCGYTQCRAEVVGDGVFAAEVNNMIVARDIEVYSLCEHHLLPFFGRCHVGYIAQHHVLGISKIARIVELHARRLQMQERLTAQIAEEVMNAVHAEGVGVVMECRHLCMMMRGVEKQNSVMTTSSVLGSFRDSPETRAEFLSLIGRRI